MIYTVARQLQTNSYSHIKMNIMYSLNLLYNTYIINYIHDNMDNQSELTTQQSLVLELLANKKAPISSADILSIMQKDNPKANRMTIHRALDKLIELGLVHKIQINNTYTICKHISNHNCQLLVCIKCGIQMEIHSHQMCTALESIEGIHKFQFINPLEINGICFNCQK